VKQEGKMKGTQGSESETQNLWASAGQHVAAANAALDEPGKATPEVAEQIWARRAAKLAQVPGQEDEGEQIELVLVQLGREVYGLEAHYVFDIRLAGQITRVPRVPDWVAGVINQRGRILSVLDLQRFFGLPEVEDSPATPHLVVVETSEMKVALLVDDVLVVDSLPAGRVQAATGTIRGLCPEYVRGVAERKDDKNDFMMVVLDLPALLADKRLTVNEKMV
jgi:purine-binding chemotaxis protein CheW